MSRPEALARRLTRRPSAMRFRVGNAGDILAPTLIGHLWGEAPRLVREQGQRLLLVGSIAHSVRDGDVLAGVGTKGHDVPPASRVRLRVVGVRGPLTLAALRDAGHDTSTVRFMGDPGLLVRTMVAPRAAEVGRVVFIPHYRERDRHWRAPPSGVHVLDVDVDPLVLADQIQRAELVLASSLHGLIFAHSMGRPAVPIRADGEPWIKYEDHYLSLGVVAPRPLADVHRWRSVAVSSSPIELPAPESFLFPTRDELQAWGITESRVRSRMRPNSAVPARRV